MLNAEQQKKAREALNKEKQKEQKQRYAMIHHLGAYMKLHYEGVMLPYKVLYDLEKQEYEGTFKEVPPNPYYPAPAMTLKTMWSTPRYEGDWNVSLDEDGYPNLLENAEFKKKTEEYKQRVDAEKMPLDKWGYYYARFLLPYDLEKFSDFDFWGEIPKDEEAKQIVDGLRISCMEAQSDCKKHPENYNMEPVPRLREHRDLYDVGYGYI